VDDPEKKKVTIDGDNPDHITWLFDRAAERAKQFNIEGVTWKLTQTVIKRIIPAVAFTNAVIAAACANEAFKIATRSSKQLKNWWAYNGSEGVYSSTTNFRKDPTTPCIVCSTEPVMFAFDRTKTLEQVIKDLVADKDKFLYLTNPSIVRKDKEEGTHMLHMTGIMATKTKPNLVKLLKDLVEEGDILFITNTAQVAAHDGMPASVSKRNYVVRVLFTPEGQTEKPK